MSAIQLTDDTPIQDMTATDTTNTTIVTDKTEVDELKLEDIVPDTDSGTTTGDQHEEVIDIEEAVTGMTDDANANSDTEGAPASTDTTNPVDEASANVIDLNATIPVQEEVMPDLETIEVPEPSAREETTIQVRFEGGATRAYATNRRQLNGKFSFVVKAVREMIQAELIEETMEDNTLVVSDTKLAEVIISQAITMSEKLTANMTTLKEERSNVFAQIDFYKGVGLGDSLDLAAVQSKIREIDGDVVRAIFEGTTNFRPLAMRFEKLADMLEEAAIAHLENSVVDLACRAGGLENIEATLLVEAVWSDSGSGAKKRLVDIRRQLQDFMQKPESSSQPHQGASRQRSGGLTAPMRLVATGSQRDRKKK